MLTARFNSLRCFSKDLGMVPSAPVTTGRIEVLSSTTVGVHVLDLDNFQFTSVGKFQSGGLREQKSQLFGLFAGFICNNPFVSSILNYIVRLNVKGRLI